MVRQLALWLVFTITGAIILVLLSKGPEDDEVRYHANYQSDFEQKRPRRIK